MKKMTMGVLVLAAGLLAAGIAWWHEPDPMPQAELPRPHASSATPTPLPVSASPSAPAASNSIPAPGAAASAPEIGSEGYGVHVQRALDSGDPKQALKAAQWIARCDADNDTEAMLNGTHPKKYRLHLPEEQRREWIERARATQRLCQTLTPDLQAQHQALALRALEAKVPGAGVAYHQTLSRESRTDDERERARRALRLDAEHGDVMAVMTLAVADLGLPRGEQLGYRWLLKRLILRNFLPAMMGGAGYPPVDPPYTAQEEDIAAALANRLLPHFKVDD